MDDSGEWSPQVKGLVIILPHQTTYVNTKPSFLSNHSIHIAAKPPYKTYKNIMVFGSNHITI
jgi:hypothetical protein